MKYIKEHVDGLLVTFILCICAYFAGGAAADFIMAPMERTEKRICFNMEPVAKNEEPEIITTSHPHIINDKQELYAAFPNDELGILALCIESEAGNQDAQGKRLVADVILNRVDHEKFPDTIHDTVTQEMNGIYQFAVMEEDMIWNISPTKETVMIAKEELENRTDKNVLYFNSEEYPAYGTPYGKIGDHWFATE